METLYNNTTEMIRIFFRAMTTISIQSVSLFTTLSLNHRLLLCEASELCPNKLWLVYSHCSPEAHQVSSDSWKAEDKRWQPQSACQADAFVEGLSC